MLTLEGLIAVLSLCIGCFSLGYAIGSRDNDKRVCEKKSVNSDLL